MFRRSPQRTYPRCTGNGLQTSIIVVAASIYLCDMHERDRRSRVSISLIARTTYQVWTIICQNQIPCYFSSLRCVELPLKQVLQIKNVLNVMLDGSVHPSGPLMTTIFYTEM